MSRCQETIPRNRLYYVSTRLFAKKYATVLQLTLHRICCIFAPKYAKICASIYKTLQLLGDEVPQTPYRGFAPGVHWRTSVPQTPYILPPTLAT